MCKNVLEHQNHVPTAYAFLEDPNRYSSSPAQAQVQPLLGKTHYWYLLVAHRMLFLLTILAVVKDHHVSHSLCVLHIQTSRFFATHHVPKYTSNNIGLAVFPIWLAVWDLPRISRLEEGLIFFIVIQLCVGLLRQETQGRGGPFRCGQCCNF